MVRGAFKRYLKKKKATDARRVGTGGVGGRGATGSEGLDGLPGLDGDEGETGPPGIAGVQGLRGLAGEIIPGVDGEDGEDGIPGVAGQDATGLLSNFSTEAQTYTTATRTYIAGSAITIPTSKLQIGTSFRWTFDMTKTAAGSASAVFDIAVGTLGTTGDTARVSFTRIAGTAVIDVACVVITAICRGPLSGAGIFAGHFEMTHNLAATGFSTLPCANVVTISSGFDVTVENLIVGLCVTGGADEVVTSQCVLAEAWNL